MHATLSCGEALVDLLEQYGVDTVFGIPGVHTLTLYRGLERSAIRHVQPRNEQGAGFMADGYARISGRPGVCFLISGPGVTNAVTAMGQAFADSVPMLVISSDTASASQGLGQGRLHEVTDLIAVTKPVTAFSARATHVEQVPELLARAFSLFSAARPRPVHISIPIDVLHEPVDARWRPRPLPARPYPDPADVARAAALLDEAERPVIVAGGGAIAASDLTSLAEQLAAPALLTTAAKGVMADDHPLALGGMLSSPAVLRLLAEADVALVIGSELAETETFVEDLVLPPRVIRIDIDPAMINDRAPAEVGIVADAAATVSALAGASGGVRRARERVEAGVAAARAGMLEDLDLRESRHRIFLDALRAALPEHAVVVGDMCQVVYAGAFLFPVTMPGRWRYAGSYCTLGCGLPGAVGARLAAPHLPVMAIAGDGGFLFTCQELLTAVDLSLPLPVVIWNNHGYQQIRDDMIARGQRPIGVDGRNPDFAAFAAACGAGHYVVDGPRALARALDATFSGNAPALLEVEENAPWLGPVAPA